MATRFYLLSSVPYGSAAVSAAFGTGWNDTSNAVGPRICTTQRMSATFTNALGVTAGGNPEFVLIEQWISDPLAFGQTISGTVSGQILAQATGAVGAAAWVAVAIRLVTLYGTDYVSVKHLVGATPASSATATTPPLMVVSPTVLTNRSLRNSADVTAIPVTSQVTGAGDRLVIEVGMRDIHGISGDDTFLRIGCDTAGDLPVDDTTTAQTLNPWVEFSQTLAFAVSDAGTTWMPQQATGDGPAYEILPSGSGGENV